MSFIFCVEIVPFCSVDFTYHPFPHIADYGYAWIGNGRKYSSGSMAAASNIYKAVNWWLQAHSLHLLLLHVEWVEPIQFYRTWASSLGKWSTQRARFFYSKNKQFIHGELGYIVHFQQRKLSCSLMYIMYPCKWETFEPLSWVRFRARRVFTVFWHWFKKMYFYSTLSVYRGTG